MRPLFCGLVAVVFSAFNYLPLICAAVSTASDVQASAPLVKLNIGTFRGQQTGNGTDRFLGIPYAQPPVNRLRFKAPVKIARPFVGVQSALQFGNACPQPPSASLGAPIGEDCLFLNVR